MRTTTFDKALGVVESLPEKQRADLVAIVRRRLAEHGRDRLVREVGAAREEYARGKAKQGTVADLLKDLHRREPSYGGQPSSARTSGLCGNIRIGRARSMRP